ncbi:MAG: ProQ/FINO family protein [Succinivibrionaceae bacterium]|nr:ProQ/FINO family protein [Succinivibrionaceae bacterium]
MEPETQQVPEAGTGDRAESPAEAAQSAVAGATESAEAPAAAPAESEGSRRDHIAKVLERLYELFPKAFVREGGGECHPLKVGVVDDLRERIKAYPDLTITKVREALHLYTTRLRYLHCLFTEPKRVDLDGNPVEEVSKEHADFAREKFKEIRATRPRPKKPRLRRRPEGAPQQGAEGAAPRPPRPRVTYHKASASELMPGTEVSVTTGPHHHVKGVVAPGGVKGEGVQLTLETGANILLPIDRVSIRDKDKS